MVFDDFARGFELGFEKVVGGFASGIVFEIILPSIVNAFKDISPTGVEVVDPWLNTYSLIAWITSLLVIIALSWIMPSFGLGYFMGSIFALFIIARAFTMFGISPSKQIINTVVVLITTIVSIINKI